MERPPRHREDSLISSWIFLRYLVIGVYVGIATVGVFVWWFVFGTDPSEAHSLVSLRQLMSWGRCSSWENFSPEPVYGMHADDPCSYFTIGKAKVRELLADIRFAPNATSEELKEKDKLQKWPCFFPGCVDACRRAL